MQALTSTVFVFAALLAGCSSTQNSAATKSPEEQQAAWVAYGTPGANHKLLAPMVGTFRTKVTSRMSADQPWSESSGTCENRWIFDGRFLETDFRGDFQGMPFEGRGMTGFDNSTQEFVGFWTDSWSTGLSPISHGTADASGKVLTLHREMKDPITGAWCKMRDVTTIQGPNAHRMESYCQMGSDPEYQMMTIEFTR